MKDIYQVLREKELDIIRVQREIAALHVVIPLLVEEAEKMERGLTPPPPFSATGTTGPSEYRSTVR